MTATIDKTLFYAVWHKLSEDEWADNYLSAKSVTIGDLDGDGYLDLAGTTLTAEAYDDVWVLLNKGDGKFQNAPSYGVGHDAESVALGDLNGDGDLDIATVTWGSANVLVLLGNGDGTFQEPVYYGVGGLQPNSLAIGDADGDGDLDIAVPYAAAVGQVSILLNQSTQGETRTIRATAGSGGGISPSGTVIVGKGAEQTFTIKADEGYQIWGVKVNNQSQGAVGTYTFSNVTEDQAILATFMENTTPTVTTTALSDIASTGATSGGHVTSEGGASVTARGVCWSPSPDPTTSDSKTSDGTGTGPFTSAITGLTPGTAYHVRAYATNSLGTSYGSDLSFTTTTTTPTVSTNAVSAITSNAASSGGNVTCDGGEPVTVRGVCWGTPPDPTTSGSYTSNGIGTGPFTSAITGLNPETTYHVRAYATNSIGTAYGTDLIFTTSTPVPMVTTTAVSSITANSASSGGDVTSEGDAPATARGVCWSTSLNPTINDSHTSDGTGPGPFTSALTGLSAGTTYHVRAYATNSVGTAYGSELTFTTSTTIPTVSTTAVSSITANSASSGGNVTSEGDAPVTARGVCWNTSPNPTISDSHTSNGTGIGSFTSEITGLSSGTIYHVRAYATNSLGTGYGSDLTFTTPTTVPTVTTTAVFSITSSTASSGGYVTSDGAVPITARGVCWSTSPNPTISDSHTSNGTGIGGYTSSITGLNSNTVYHVRAYAINSHGTAYGDDVVFITNPPPVDGNLIETYPSASSSKESDLYRVEVYRDGTWVDTDAYQYSRQSKDGWWYYGEYPSVHWTTIGVSKNVQAFVRVTRLTRSWKNEPFSSVEVLPSRYNIMPFWNSDTIRFKIEQNQKVYIRTNDQDYDTLFIFANPPKPPVPPKAKYFGLGVHNIGINYGLLPSEQDVYLDGGAWVVGSLNITDAAGDVSIMGPGVLSGEFEVWENVKDLPFSDSFPYMMIHTDGTVFPSFNLTVQGITIVASPWFNFGTNLNGSKFIDNLHIISPWTYNTDGLGIGSRGHTTHTFVFNNDDTIQAEYTYDSDMTVSNCVLAGRNPFLVGYGYFGESDPYQATISNIDLILQNNYIPFHAEVDGISSDIIVDNQIYENINIDGNVRQFMYLSIEDTGWGAPNPALGNIRDLTFNNITVQGRQSQKSVIRGKDANNRIDNIKFTNLIIDGTPVTNYNCTQFFDIDWATASVTFDIIAMSPSVTTISVSFITGTTASSGGNVTFGGGATITAKGVCWSTSANPTIGDSHTSDGTGTGSFTSSITALSAATTYHVRAYATNSAGTGYGSDVAFKTSYASTLYVSLSGDCGDKIPCYHSIQGAIDAVSTGSVIFIAEGSYEESILLNVSKTLTLKGGWDSAFTTQSSCTTVNSITISNGTVAVDRLVIH